MRPSQNEHLIPYLHPPLHSRPLALVHIASALHTQLQRVSPVQLRLDGRCVAGPATQIKCRGPVYNASLAATGRCSGMCEHSRPSAELRHCWCCRRATCMQHARAWTASEQPCVPVATHACLGSKVHHRHSHSCTAQYLRRRAQLGHQTISSGTPRLQGGKVLLWGASLSRSSEVHSGVASTAGDLAA